MKEWLYITYIDKDGQPREYAVSKVNPAFVIDQMDEYVKYNSAVIRGVAYKISAETGKPNFRTPIAISTLPF